MPNDSLSLAQGAIAPWGKGESALLTDAVKQIGAYHGIDINAPFGKLPKKQRELILLGPSAAGKAPADGWKDRAACQ